MDACQSMPRRKSCVRVTAGGVPVNTLELRDYLKAYEEEDTLIARLARRATSFCQRWQGRQYLVAQFSERYDEFPTGGDQEISLLWSPGYSATGYDTQVIYLDTDGTSQTLSLLGGDFSGNLEAVRPVLRPNYGEVWPATLCYPDAVRVNYFAGVASEDLVDDEAKQAIWMLACHWYRNREAVLTGTISKEIDFSVTKLLGPRRILAVA